MAAPTILTGDCLDVLATLPADTFQACVTSPPYFGLRDYGVDGQIGLEESPEAYVAKMVEVFRAVRRVLRPDGTVFLNLGDSYSAGGMGPGSGKQLTNVGAGISRKAAPEGFKPKDLLGIPWMVAKALRAPYYTGRIRDVADRIWLAAMIDAEGCLFIHRRKAGQANGNGYFRQNDSFGPGLEVANTSLAIVERCQQITGLGSICSQTPDTNNRRKQTIYRWNLRTTECRDVVREVYPHLVGKRQQARILIGCPSSGEKATAAHAALISLHRSGLSDVDFPEPASMFEPGWYLRSAIVWSKLNPMPESVRDRPTSSYEMVFLLSKAASYFYDQDAIREPHTSDPEGLNDPSLRKAIASDAGSQFVEGGLRRPPSRPANYFGHELGRNARNVWTIATQPYSGAHFATMPPDLAERCIKAGSKPGDHVLDPFGGAGTTGLVASRLQRRATLIELNPAYADMARERCHADAPLLMAEVP